MEKINAGLGEKVGIFLQSISILIVGIVISFTKNWELSLVALSLFPLVVFSFALVGVMLNRYTGQAREAYAKANGIANEVLSCIKTIFAFEGQDKELERYSAHLLTAEKLGIKMSTNMSIC